jgi:hypothetical protein
MKTQRFAPIIAVAVLAANLGMSGSNPGATQSQMVITVRTVPGAQPETLEASDVQVLHNNSPAHVVRLRHLAGDLADMQLFVFLDDSTRSSSLGIHIQELKTFLESLPASTQVAVGYMRNGTFGLTQAFTADHQKAADALRLPMSLPGGNASPYFALSDLAKHWPSKETTGRRAVLMLTDGVDPYWDTSVMDDPYVDTAVRDALKQGVMVSTIYLRGAGLYGRGAWVTNFAQSRLMQVAEQTGGHAYFEAFTDPVNIAQFLSDYQDRLNNQYQVTVDGLAQKGVQPVKVRTELQGLKIEAPTRIYVR